VFFFIFLDFEICMVVIIRSEIVYRDFS